MVFMSVFLKVVWKDVGLRTVVYECVFVNVVFEGVCV